MGRTRRHSKTVFKIAFKTAFQGFILRSWSRPERVGRGVERPKTGKTLSDPKQNAGVLRRPDFRTDASLGGAIGQRRAK
jgi:hypothetical protein